MIGQVRLSSLFALKGSRCLDLDGLMRQKVDEPRRKVPCQVVMSNRDSRRRERVCGPEITTSRNHAGVARAYGLTRGCARQMELISAYGQRYF